MGVVLGGVQGSEGKVTGRKARRAGWAMPESALRTREEPRKLSCGIESLASLQRRDRTQELEVRGKKRGSMSYGLGKAASVTAEGAGQRPSTLKSKGLGKKQHLGTHLPHKSSHTPLSSHVCPLPVGSGAPSGCSGTTVRLHAGLASGERSQSPPPAPPLSGERHSLSPPWPLLPCLGSALKTHPCVPAGLPWPQGKA